ncbi:MAG: hypothetical protein DSY90_11565 [Deltaproteobacteria bacterium]|nr:MAG: hypothetical protein DSY90_11565 [Deltaproteobacteria bacterium]
MPAAPYQDLFIYYLSGRVSTDREFGPHFIGNWQEADSSFLFFSTPSRPQVDTLVAEQPGLVFEDEYQMSYDQWQGGHLQPVAMGRFNIIPPWASTSTCGRIDSKTEIDIFLDPGVVFGNGLHPTTRDCLEALQMLREQASPLTVLDLGTGTGLLALAAARLGARRVLAVDLNHLAVKTTWANLKHNQLQDRVLAVQGRAEDFVDRPADLLMANIHFDVMKQMVGAAGFLARPWLILSGLLRSEARFITDQLTRQGASIIHDWVHEGTWHTFLVRSG